MLLKGASAEDFANFEKRINAEFSKSKKSGTMNIKVRRCTYKEWVVNLNTTESTILGWQLNAAEDSAPVVVSKIRPIGAVAKFNEDMEHQRIMTGDQVVQVDTVPWTGASSQFLRRVNELHVKSKKSGMITFKLRRSTEDARPMRLLMKRNFVRPVAKEWSIKLPATEGTIIGWQLNSTEDGMPVVVSKIRTMGAVPRWNQDHLENTIRPGDQVVKVNDVLWRGASSEFEKKINTEYTKSKKNGTMFIFMRRFADVDFDEEDTSRPFFKEFNVRLEAGPGKTPGWQLNTSNASAAPVIAKVRVKGAVADWNDAHPLDEIEAGDQIVKAQNVLWHGNTQKFMDRLNMQLDAARKGKGPQTIELLIQRPWRSNEGGDNDGDVIGGGEGDVTGAGEDDVMGATEN